MTLQFRKMTHLFILYFWTCFWWGGHDKHQNIGHFWLSNRFKF